MDDPNITMEEYIRLEEEKAHRRGKVYNWETATHGKIWYDEDVHDLRFVETEFPAMVFNDTLTSEQHSRVSLWTSRKEIADVGDVFINLEILKCWSLEISRRLFNTILLINATWRIYRAITRGVSHSNSF
ncbi:hypothetical protein Tco_0969611 [Tanacetum coccineum]